MITEPLKTGSEIIRNEFAQTDIIVKAILLFGSRARSMENSQGDWDFFIITDKEPKRAEKLLVLMKIRRKLADLNIDGDLIVKSEAKYLEDREDVGKITYYAVKEGLPL